MKLPLAILLTSLNFSLQASPLQAANPDRPVRGQPIERIGGACPPGYYRNGAYCVPGAGYKKPAIPKAGHVCPPGYHQNGKYCVK
jgi:hypothetical protein